MAITKEGVHIKGTKKSLPDGWSTYAFRYAIFPTPEQVTKLEKSFGCERKVYNEYVSDLYEYLESIGFESGFIRYKVPNYTTITAKYDYLDKSNDSFVYNDAKMRFQAAIKKYNETYAKQPIQYKKSVRKKMKTIGYVPTLKDIKGMPKFHSKKQGKLSYTTNQTNGNIKITQENGAYFLCIPKFQEGISIHLHRELPIDGIIKKATIKREGTKYVVSLSVDYFCPNEKQVEFVTADEVIGLDYSQSELYVDSEGRTAQYSRYNKIIEKRQRRINKSLARKKNNAKTDETGNIVYSKNYEKQVKEYQKVTTKAKNQRKDFLHKKSNQITNDYHAIVVEDLNLSNLAQCLSLGKKLHDNGFGMFRMMLQYKSKKKGKYYIVADKYFASSKLCSECNHKKDKLKISERIYMCDNCGTKIDRDYNAGRNLKYYGIRILHEQSIIA
ncbi:RNA-guided endonuclease InsQ/TnpB family protein [Bacillus sp. WLY-B-L8]|uniref:RNA-guided endonuclease InsQ/TnpB family protein n=1 Tax=Bacillus multifaciens TaxID=3068506 RepID=UPI0027419474|nr:transposase [Bacillus sp. WLY-B-L8]MDP7979558.1 transposase [Bacillus sp. WLY-B-L8]